MELLNTITGMPYVFHCVIVSAVFIGAILLFVFGFKSADEPAFNKSKADSKSVKKKKGKEKKSLNANVNAVENKSKGNSTQKPKGKTADEKSKKINALKESKNININVKNTKKEHGNNEKNKKKGKENVNSNVDFSDEEGGWEQALSRKSRKGQNNILTEAKGSDGKAGNQGNKSPKKEVKNKWVKENPKKNSASGTEKKPKDNEGEWQEAKSSKKRRKVLKED